MIGGGSRALALALLSTALLAGACRREPPIFDAVRKRDLATLEKELRTPGAQAARDAKGRTPLHLAAELSEDEVAEILLKAKADPNARDDAGRTPLHARVEPPIVDAGADLDAKANDGSTPLHARALARDAFGVAALCACGASRTARDARGRTPLAALQDAAYDKEKGAGSAEWKETYALLATGGLCDELGRLFSGAEPRRSGDVVRLSFLVLRCDGGEVPACNSVGDAFLFGKGVVRDEAKALPFYERSCARKEPTSCRALGYLYEMGLGVAKDVARAKQLFEASCRDGEGHACFRLAQLYHYGVAPVEPDLAAAARSYEEACAKGEKEGCGRLGRLIADGTGVPRDESRGAGLLEKACEDGFFEACNNLGVLYQNGRGVPHDDVKARALYRKACQGGDLVACGNEKDLAAETAR